MKRGRTEATDERDELVIHWLDYKSTSPLGLSMDRWVVLSLPVSVTLGTGSSKLLQLDKYLSLNVHVVLALGGASCVMKWLGEG